MFVLPFRHAGEEIAMSTATAPSLEDIRRDFERVPPEVVGKASQFAASILADVAGRRGALDGRIAPVAPEMKLCGPAFTIEVRAGDNLMIHAAMTIAKPGDILVIDGKGDRSCALMGSIMINACKALKLGGVVIDAAVRDTLELRELGFPVFAVGANPNGPTKFVPGRMNWPISCGGIAVAPGDLVVGDADGVVVIEREKAASLLDAAAKKVADETSRIAGIKQGKDLRPKWLEGSLRAAGLLKEGEKL
jgi:regulator of RNase E activity RraA